MAWSWAAVARFYQNRTRPATNHFPANRGSPPSLVGQLLGREKALVHGNDLELAWDRPPEQWPSFQEDAIVFLEAPLELDDLLAAAV